MSWNFNLCATFPQSTPIGIKDDPCIHPRLDGLETHRKKMVGFTVPKRFRSIVPLGEGEAMIWPSAFPILFLRLWSYNYNGCLTEMLETSMWRASQKQWGESSKTSNLPLWVVGLLSGAADELMLPRGFSCGALNGLTVSIQDGWYVSMTCAFLPHTLVDSLVFFLCRNIRTQMEWTYEIFRVKADRFMFIDGPKCWDTHTHIYSPSKVAQRAFFFLWNRTSQHRARSGTLVLGDRNKIGFVIIAGSTLVSPAVMQMMFKPIFFRRYQLS